MEPAPHCPARRRRGTALLATALLLSIALAGCGSDEPDEEATPSPTPTAEESPTPSSEASPTGGESRTARPRGPARPKVTATVASGLAVPWGIDFTPDGSAIVTERDTARVLVVVPDGETWDVSEVGTIAEADPAVEGGLLGVAVSPDFADDRSVFFYVTTAEDNRIVRASFAGGGLGPTEPVLTGIPKGPIHDGGRIAFGPDGHLYASTGETGEPELAQDPDSLAGKILRITPEGDPAPGNPDPDSPVWSLGHRNVQGLAWDDTDQLWASEFGASTWDELNLIEPGDNYGWPRIEGLSDDNPGVPAGGLHDPVATWRTDQASPSGLAWSEGALWLGALRGTRLWQVTTARESRAATRAHFVGDYGRLRTVVAAPDGTLWVTTSNKDGRGTPAAEDDRILQVTLSR